MGESGNSVNHLLNVKDQDLSSETAHKYYKNLKEDIVSGYNGGQKLQVCLMVAYLPVRISRTQI